jgi:deoxyribodipyrimidine photo-lyase
MRLKLRPLIVLALFSVSRGFHFCRPTLSIRTVSKRKLDTTIDELQQKKLKPDDHATSVPPVEGFQLSRTRLMTGSGNFQGLTGDCVVLWMSRDQRVNDNHAFNYAQSIALEKKIPLRVVFNLVPKFLQATLRQYSFMLDGLKEVERQCNALNIPFHLLFGLPVENIPKFVLDKNAAALVTDFSPLRVSREWVSAVASEIKTQAPTTPFVQVDAHNIIPCWVASPKLEYSARTFRSKVHGKIAEYLNEIPPPVQHPYGSLDTEPVNWNTVLDSLEINRDVQPVNWIVSGPSAAEQMLQDFITQRLALYAENRNDPNKIAISNLSPYIHFGQISVQSMVLKLKKLKKYATSVDGFIEEAVVRRELTDNFCYCTTSILLFH